MRFTEIIKSAFQSIWSRKIRSFLTMLGVIIGVFAVASLLAVGENSIKEINESFSNLGAENLSAEITKEGAKISMEDIEKLQDYDSIDSAAPFLKASADLKNGGKSEKITVVGTSWQGARVMDYKLSTGRFIVGLDIEKQNKSVVLGSDLAQRLFGDTDIIGEKVNIGSMKFTIVGVLAPMYGNPFENPNMQVIIPVTTGQTFLGMGELNSFKVKAISIDDVYTAKRKIFDFISEKINSREGFTINAEGEIGEALKESNITMMAMLAGIGGISLLVSGIGIMNIMLVSVKERTREIGIRKAIGARRRDILKQFLIEAMVLSFLGGIIGTLLTFLLSVPIGQLLSFEVTPSLNVLLLSVLFSLIVGIVFGFYPAASASKLRPVEALHYE